VAVPPTPKTWIDLSTKVCLTYALWAAADGDDPSRVLVQKKTVECTWRLVGYYMDTARYVFGRAGLQGSRARSNPTPLDVDSLADAAWPIITDHKGTELFRQGPVTGRDLFRLLNNRGRADFPTTAVAQAVAARLCERGQLVKVQVMKSLEETRKGGAPAKVAYQLSTDKTPGTDGTDTTDRTDATAVARAAD
jgi:hypothetical protein